MGKIKNKIRKKDVSISYSLYRVTRANRISRGILISLVGLFTLTMSIMKKRVEGTKLIVK